MKREFRISNSFYSFIYYFDSSYNINSCYSSGKLFKDLSIIQKQMEFFVSAENKKTITEAKQENLEELGINIDIKKFTSGVIKKPMAIPNTYEELENQSKGFVDLIRAPITGIADSIDIIIFIIVLGGTVGVINKTGTFNTAMKAISLRTKGKEFLLIIIAFIFVALGGTTFWILGRNNTFLFNIGSFIFSKWF